MPCAASASSSSRCARESGVRSAVAWTSTRPPSPVMTTFASTSARRVLGVVEVEQRHAADDRRTRPRRPCRSAASAASSPSATSRAQRERERDVAAGDRRAARAAVGLRARRSRGRSCARRAPRSRRRRAASGRSGAGSRPCARRGGPCVTSRCLRSPVDAGSIPYSAVTQPRPLAGHPARHATPRPTRCRSRASRRTEISAEPVAVRTKPGSIVDRAQLVRRRGRRCARGSLTRRLRSAQRRRARPSPSGICRKRVPSARNASTSPVHRKR